MLTVSSGSTSISEYHVSASTGQAERRHVPGRVCKAAGAGRVLCGNEPGGGNYEIIRY